ncbi:MULTISPECIES: TonB-dependent siderophore receptor [Pseudomonas]|uniref:TonB-dependent siderophore receptor n=3 Tax=Pseudomonas chlororaphis TaxID=587753 RepID=A0AAP9VQS7_9PSED|nr:MULTISPECIES: TonB-dependent siderophore receptor [Pseudomonas]AIC21250.1 ligand-gated channel [Pseudomonas chlororaphis]AUG42138.1 TonB-dependent siderophore receptor [Pseudomonas chlororaphis]EIM18071.1 TonB-dependent outermembrane ferripyoverdine receptor FpvA [Pseudomonas chlororaphis O6]KAB0534148.1 TonB-dependent siderophore receptor [Pseudomonas chlororaphis subsp. aureofaciens]PWY51146.1 TonB-dependent siderophore receptor [Pseudomonas sp. RW409]
MSMPAQHRLTPLAKALLGQAFSPRMASRTLGLALTLPLMAQVQAQEIHFNIAAQSMASALQEFGRQANLQVLYSPDDVQGKRSNALSGSYSPERAIAAMLNGTGVAYSLKGNSVTILNRASAGSLELGTSTITAQGLDSTTEDTGSYTTGPMQTASKLALTARETPQSVTVITRQRMDDQNMKTLEDVLKATPGISVTKDGPQRPTFYSRGFAIENLMVDGLSNDLSHYLSRDMNSTPDMAIFDRVEVVRGATGLMQGAGNPSAAVNMVHKRPTATPRVTLTGSAGSWDNYRTEFDASNALNESGTLRGRIVTAYQTKDSFQDFVSSERSVFYGITEADLNEDTTFTFGISNQNANNNTSWGGLPVAADGSDLHLKRSTYLGSDWEFWDQDNTTAFTRLEYRFANDWKMLLAASKSWSDLSMLGSIPMRTWQSDYVEFGQNIGRYDYKDKQSSYDGYVSGPFSLFGRTHELVVGASKRDLKFKGKGLPIDLETHTDLNNPSGIPKPDMSANPWTQDRTSELKSTYVTTRLNLADDLKLILGGRLDWYDYDVTTTWNGKPSSTSLPNKVTRNLTRYAGVIYDLDQHHSVYVSYTDIFKPQTELDASNNALKPIEGKNYEMGIKGEYFDGALNASAAIFRIDQENRAKLLNPILCPPGNDCYEAAGEVRSQGIELEINGSLAPGWQLGAGYTYASVKYTKDSDPTKEGTLFDTDIPRHVFKAFTTYQLPGDLNRWTIGGGLYRQNTIYNKGTNEYLTTFDYHIEQKAYTLVDLMTSYKASENVNIRLNLNNVFDKRYYQSISSNTDYGNNFYGDPRNAMVTVSWSL